MNKECLKKKRDRNHRQMQNLEDDIQIYKILPTTKLKYCHNNLSLFCIQNISQ